MNAFLGTGLFLAAGSLLGLSYYIWRRPGAQAWTQGDLLTSLVAVALTGLVSLAVSGHVATGLALADHGAMADLGSLAVPALLDLAGLAIFLGFVRRVSALRRRAGPGIAAAIAVADPANDPGAPRPSIAA